MSVLAPRPSDTPPAAPSAARTRAHPERRPEPDGPGSDAPPALEAPADRASSGPAAWLIGPLLLAATLVGVTLVLRGPDRLFLWALGGLFGVALAWVLVSVFFPASVDRTCPACGRPELARLDARTTRGLRCAGCGWSDATTSSFLMAEAEGPLEDVVLRERGRARAPQPEEVAP